MNLATQRYVAFSFGVVFVVTLLVLAITFPSPTPFQYMVFRLVLSLAAAGVAAMIPGFIAVQVGEWARAGGALAVFVLSYFYNPAALVVEKAEVTAATCNVSSSVTSDVVARVYSRGPFDPKAAEQTLRPTSQELFYEWKAVLAADGPARNVAVELHHLQDGDRVTLQPPTAGSVSEESKHWYSGFPEPTRSRPDYLIRTLRLNELPAGSPATVIVRRPLEKPTDGPGQLITLDNPHAANCRVSPSLPGETDSAERLQTLAVRLTGNIYRMGDGGNPVPLRSDPGDVGEREIQVTVEMRCKNQDCTMMESRQLEARMGKSPGEYARELRIDQLRSLKEDLADVFGCIDGPQTDPDPTRDGEVIRMCGDPVHLSAQDAQRLMSIFQKHGVQLNIAPPGVPKGDADERR